MGLTAVIRVKSEVASFGVTPSHCHFAAAVGNDSAMGANADEQGTLENFQLHFP
jgi:hypothetical protein